MGQLVPIHRDRGLGNTQVARPVNGCNAWVWISWQARRRPLPAQQAQSRPLRAKAPRLPQNPAASRSKVPRLPQIQRSARSRAFPYIKSKAAHLPRNPASTVLWSVPRNTLPRPRLLQSGTTPDWLGRNSKVGAARDPQVLPLGAAPWGQRCRVGLPRGGKDWRQDCRGNGLLLHFYQ